jgi:hypothetical protein
MAIATTRPSAMAVRRGDHQGVDGGVVQGAAEVFDPLRRLGSGAGHVLQPLRDGVVVRIADVGDFGPFDPGQHLGELAAPAVRAHDGTDEGFVRRTPAENAGYARAHTETETGRSCGLDKIPPIDRCHVETS